MTDHEQTQEDTTKTADKAAVSSNLEPSVSEQTTNPAEDTQPESLALVAEEIVAPALEIEWDSALEDEIKGGKKDRPRPQHKPKKPASTFSELPLSDSVRSAIENMGWSTPTPVQAECLPYTLDNRDVAGFAQTGTGKTGVFLVSLAHQLEQHRKRQEEAKNEDAKGCQPFALVLAPTRELAVQIEDDCSKLFELLKIRSLAVYGGTDWEQLAKKLRKGVDVIIATPGRLLDYERKNVIDVSKLGMFVCDEVDRMFDMGFIDDVEKLLKKAPEKCQKLLFSATTNDRVHELAFEYLDQPEYISVNPEELAPERIEQHALLCETPEKLRVLMGLLREHNPERAIIFANTKLTAAWLQYKLSRNQFQVSIITGDLPQNKRIKLIECIKQGQVRYLIATDVASRGLHISGVTHVYNFDIPDDPSNYVHRIGRTARAGASGSSYTLVCDVYSENFAPIQEMLGEAAPKSRWFDSKYLEIKDQAGNPFDDNFGRPEPEPEPRRPDHARPHSRDRKPDTRKETPHRNKNQPQKKHPKKDAHSGNKKTQTPVATKKATPSVGALARKLFNVFFGWLKK
ncbi:MAG: DEAD/DEAH box helicase [Oligoflexales bacterium]